MQRSSILASVSVLLLLVPAACGKSNATSGGSGAGATSTGAGAGGDSTSCPEAVCEAVLQCCNMMNFPDQTQKDVCIGFANDCSMCDAALMSYQAMGMCTGLAGSSSSSGGVGGAGTTTSGSGVTTGSGTTTSTSGASTSSSSSSSSSSGACALPDPTGKAYLGAILMSDTSSPTVKNQYSVIGDFIPGPPAAACSGTQMGACCYEGPGNATGTMQTAGTITVTDAGKTLVKLNAQPYVATNATTPGLTWTAGSTIKVTGSGGTVDAFDLTVVAPAALAGLVPAFGAATVDVAKTSPLVVSWTPSAEACSQIAFGLSQTSATGALAHIGCVSADSAGTLTVPQALLAKFTATTGEATIERIEGAGVNVANANVKLVVAETRIVNVAYK